MNSCWNGTACLIGQCTTAHTFPRLSINLIVAKERLLDIQHSGRDAANVTPISDSKAGGEGGGFNL